MRHSQNVTSQSVFVCPSCRSHLTSAEGQFTCNQCQSGWKVEYGIPRFAKTEVEWSVFNAEVAEDVTSLAEKSSWREAIDSYSHLLGIYSLNYIEDESRADWHIIMPIDEDSTILDIGSGWGNIAISLSRWCREVYCCDVNLTNLRLLKVRIRDNGIDNVTIFQYEPNSFLRLPFPDSSLDIVVLNGVLEWMGVAEIDASPTQIQLAALKEIRRILKSNGALYIGIENRYSISTILGQRIHGELPFIGLLPRWLSNILTRIFRGEQHRTYIHSLRGYRKLLLRAGFKQTEFFIPYPSYHHPNYLIPVKPAWVKQFWIEQLSLSRSKKYQIFITLGFHRLPFHWFAYSYSIKSLA